MISKSLAARLKSDHHSEARRMEKDRRNTMSEIHTSVGVGLASQPLVQVPHLPEDRAMIPFYIHPSHDVIYVGGFVACNRCGVTNSQPLARQHLPISKPCEPDLHGEMRPETGQGQRKLKTSFQNLKRLRDGRPPYGYQKWPDGSGKEEIKRVYVLSPPPSEDPTVRLLVPESAHGVGSFVQP